MCEVNGVVPLCILFITGTFLKCVVLLLLIKISINGVSIPDETLLNKLSLSVLIVVKYNSVIPRLSVNSDISISSLKTNWEIESLNEFSLKDNLYVSIVYSYYVCNPSFNFLNFLKIIFRILTTIYPNHSRTPIYNSCWW
jgi:hypothetical protein